MSGRNGLLRNGAGLSAMGFLGICGVLLCSCNTIPKRATTWPTLVTKMNQVGKEAAVPIEEIGAGSLGKVSYIGAKVEFGDRTLLLQIDTGSSLTLLRESLRSTLNARPVSRAEVLGAR